MTHQLDADGFFIHCVQRRCAEKRMDFFLVEPLWIRAFLEAFDALAEAYLAGVRWEAAGELEARAARLLAGLFLARVDGKSPVEYITAESDRDVVRTTALPFIAEPPRSVHALRMAWADRLGVE